MIFFVKRRALQISKRMATIQDKIKIKDTTSRNVMNGMNEMNETFSKKPKNEN